MDYSLRDAREDDLDAIWHLNEAAVPAVNSVPPATLRWFREVADHFRLVDVDGQVGGFLLALPPGLDYGSLNYAWFSARYDRFCYIDRLAIAADRRRLGLARALYDDLLTRVGPRVPRLVCEVNLRPRNDASLAFHSALGFSEVGQQDTEQGQVRVSLLARDLAAPVAD